MRSVAIALLICGQSFGAAAYVQSANVFTESAAPSLTVAYTSNVSSGSCLIAWGAYDDPANTSVVSDTAGNNWQRAFISNIGPDFIGGRTFWYAANAIAGADTVMITNVGATQAFLALGISEFSGAPNCAPDRTAEAVGTAATSWDSGSATTRANGEIIIGSGSFTAGSSTIVSGAGFTQMENIDGNNFEYQIQTSAGAIAASFTTATPSDFYANMVTFFSSTTVRHRSRIM